MGIDTRNKTFRIRIECDVELSDEQVWPDGDAPENPTNADVIRELKDAGGVGFLIREWGLEDDCVVEVNGVAVPEI